MATKKRTPTTAMSRAIRRGREVVATISAAVRELESAPEAARARALSTLITRAHAGMRARKEADATRLALMGAVEEATRLPEPSDLLALRATARHNGAAAKLLENYPPWRELSALQLFALRRPEHAALLAPATLTPLLGAWGAGRGHWAAVRRLLMDAALEATPPTAKAIERQWLTRQRSPARTPKGGRKKAREDSGR